MSESADVIVVGGGTVGGWCAWFLAKAGFGRIVVVERSKLGRGASSRAAGMVRAQGGTETAVKLGMWSIDFYRNQHEILGVDSGFVEQGYFMPAFNDAEVADAKARITMQKSLGLDVDWIAPDEAQRLNPTLAPGCNLGGSFAKGDGYIDPPRNVLAYTSALVRAGVEDPRGPRVHRAARIVRTSDRHRDDGWHHRSRSRCSDRWSRARRCRQVSRCHDPGRRS